jgi:hypothetical protein
MKTILRLGQRILIILVLLILGVIPAAAQDLNPQNPPAANSKLLFLPAVASNPQPAAAVGVAGKGSSPVDNLERFQQVLDKANFAWEKGSFAYIDLVKETCLGNAPNTLANNPWPNAYVVLQLPERPGQPEFPFPFPFQLGEDEAVIMIGQTPPLSMFYNYQTFVGFLPGSKQFMMVPYGDSINIGTIRVNGPDLYNRPFVIIITGSRAMEQHMRSALLAAGYPASIINVEALSPIIGPLGYGEKGSVLMMGHRVAGVETEQVLRKYITETVSKFGIFRVTPKFALAADPEPAPLLRVRGTGRTEMELYPALKRLHAAILKEYAGIEAQELDSHIWTFDSPPIVAEKPYVGLQRQVAVLGATRDTNYIGTYPNFVLNDTNDFVIAYGVNHQKTGKVTYSSVSVYADKYRWMGVATMLSRSFGDSARHYLPGDPDADMLYAIKVARDCKGEDHCLEVKYTFEDIDGKQFTCTPPLDLDTAEMFFLFRSYMEPGTKVSPDDNELLYDRAIFFGN